MRYFIKIIYICIFVLVLSACKSDQVKDVDGYKVTDTGQSCCFDGIGNQISTNCPEPNNDLAQDGSYQIKPQSYRDNGDGTILDNNTGLVWEQAGHNQGNWQSATEACSNMILGNLTAWRLPSHKELTLLLNLNSGLSGPLIEETYFTSTQLANYWTSTVSPQDNNSVIGVSFQYGAIETYAKADVLYKRCVNGPEVSEKPIYREKNEAVLDIDFGLIWQKGDALADDWESALYYCENLKYGGKEDWRMPNLKELIHLVDYSYSKPAVNQDFFPVTKNAPYFTSTSNPLNAYFVFQVDFDTGKVIPAGDKNNSGYVRCIRGGL